MKLETDKLEIIPLDYQQELKYLACNFSLEIELGLNKVDRIISEPLKSVIENIILPNIKNNQKEFLYNTTWIIINKVNKTIVGSLGFKGKPNLNKEIEIGYGTESNYQNKGFMSEAISALVLWAQKNPEINYIIAETENINIQSEKVLSNNNFTIFDKNENMNWWKLKTY